MQPDLEVFVQTHRPAVERALDEVLPAEDVAPAVLHRAMRYAVFSGGKRLRPLLCLAMCEAVGGAAAAACRPAAAVELLHTYTLVHDDLPCMDDDEERRGRPTVHVVFGEANAVLAGDALQALAFEAAAGTVAPAGRSAGDFVRELAVAAGSRGVVGGQVEDLAAPGTTDLAAIRFIHRRKTAALFRAATGLGALAGGAPDDALAAAHRFGDALGMAFQIVDDLLDDEPPGGPPGAGRRETTCLAAMTPDEARAAAGDYVAEARQALSRFAADRVRPLTAISEFVTQRRH